MKFSVKIENLTINFHLKCKYFTNKMKIEIKPDKLEDFKLFVKNVIQVLINKNSEKCVYENFEIECVNKSHFSIKFINDQNTNQILLKIGNNNEVLREFEKIYTELKF